MEDIQVRLARYLTESGHGQRHDLFRELARNGWLSPTALKNDFPGRISSGIKAQQAWKNACQEGRQRLQDAFPELDLMESKELFKFEFVVERNAGDPMTAGHLKDFEKILTKGVDTFGFNAGTKLNSISFVGEVSK